MYNIYAKLITAQKIGNGIMRQNNNKTATMTETLAHDLLTKRISKCMVNDRYECNFNISTSDKWMDWEVNPAATKSKSCGAYCEIVDKTTSKVNLGELRIAKNEDLTESSRYSASLYFKDSAGKILSGHSVTTITLMLLS